MKFHKVLHSSFSYLFLTMSFLLLSACGGGSDNASNGTPSLVTALTGVFEDSKVEGVSYKTATRSGITNSTGEYKYIEGETVTFFLGDVIFGSAKAGPLTTPLSLVAGAVDETNPVVTNIVRLLMTMDADGDPKNGIKISAATAAAAVGQVIDFNAADFVGETVALLAAIPAAPTLVDVAAAQAHFASTLAAQSNWGALSWGTGTWKAKP